MVKCADCGFLTMRNRYTGGLDEMVREFRETGEPPTRKRPPVSDATTHPLGWSDNIWPYANVPLCFVLARDEYGDFAVAPKDLGYQDFPSSMVLEILQKDRECEAFTRWMLGFTPKEHREMLDREQARKLDEDRRKSDRRWHVVELITITLMAGAFTILGAVIGSR